MKRSTSDLFEKLFLGEPALEVSRQSVQRAYELLLECYSQGHKVLVCGNGGSAADAEHIVGELMKAFRLPRPLLPEQMELLEPEFGDDFERVSSSLQRALPAISLVSQSSLVTAFTNDVSADLVFAQQVLGYGTAGDLLIAISTSGNSLNVVNAAKAARAFGLSSIGLTGEGGGILGNLCTMTIRVPAVETADVQEHHLKIYHALCAMVEAELFSDE